MVGDDLTDDYVAKLLAKDARESSLKYSDLGMGAFIPSKWVITLSVLVCWHCLVLTA